MYRYVNRDRSATKRVVQHAEKRGVKGLFITVDAPQVRTTAPSIVFPQDLDLRYLSSDVEKKTCE